MPIYDYRCTSCGHQKEVLRKISDEPLTDCPECKQPTFAKALSAAGFQLKGSGWYATDFKGGSSASSGASPAKSEAAPAATPCGGSCACH